MDRYPAVLFVQGRGDRKLSTVWTGSAEVLTKFMLTLPLLAVKYDGVGKRQFKSPKESVLRTLLKSLSVPMTHSDPVLSTELCVLLQN